MFTLASPPTDRRSSEPETLCCAARRTPHLPCACHARRSYVVLGSVPAVLVGSLLSSSAPDRYIRPAITFVVTASGLKYVGVGTTALGWILCAILLAGASSWLAYKRPWRSSNRLGDLEPTDVTPQPEAE